MELIIEAIFAFFAGFLFGGLSMVIWALTAYKPQPVKTRVEAKDLYPPRDNN